MKSKLVLIFEQSFGPDIKIVANNERDLIKHLSDNYYFTNLKINEDDFLSYTDTYKTTQIVQLYWVNEI